MLPAMISAISATKLSATAATFTPTAAAARFSDVSLFLRGRGSNAANNSSFVDTGVGANVISTIGNPTQGRNSPFNQTGFSLNFTGGTDSLQFSNAGAICPMGTAAWSIDGFVTFEANDVGYQPLMVNSNGTEQSGYALTIDDTNRLAMRVSDTNAGWAVSLVSTYTPPVGKPVHIYVARSGTVISLYADGTRLATATISASLSFTAPTADKLYIGRSPFYPGGAISFKGKIHCLRFRTTAALGVAATYVVPTTFAVATGSSVIVGMYNRIYDNSANKWPVTITGNVTVIPGSPLQPLLMYYDDQAGGSAYLNGSTDAFTCPASATNFNLGTSAMTIAAYVYPTAAKADSTIYGDQDANDQNGSISFFINENSFLCASWWTNATTKVTQVSSLKALPGQWSHVYITRSTSGTTLYFGCNGVVVSYAGVLPATLLNGTKPYFGKAGAIVSSNKFFAGHISFISFAKTVSTITATYTVPTVPVTTGAAFRLYLRFINAGVVDYATQNNLTLVNGAAMSTARAKYNPGMIDISGNKHVSIPTAPQLIPGLRTFTLRTWIYKDSQGNPSTYDASGILFKQYNSPTDHTILAVTADNRVSLTVDGIVIFTTPVAALVDDYTHFTLERADTTLFAFLGGVLVVSMDIQKSQKIGTNSAYTYIGDPDGVVGQTMYVDDFCLSMGKVEYITDYGVSPQLFYGQERYSFSTLALVLPGIDTVAGNTLDSSGSIVITNLGEVPVRGPLALTTVRNNPIILPYTNSWSAGNIAVGGTASVTAVYHPQVKETYTDTITMTFQGKTETATVQMSAGLNIKTFQMNGTIETWTAPNTASYLVDVIGAQGGDNTGYVGGGFGAYILSKLSLTAGQGLKVLVGGMGYDWDQGGSGGGGTFVTTSANVPLLVAGGGSGGSGGGYSASTNPGLTTNNGTTNGNTAAGGGAGLVGNGANNALSFTNGGTNFWGTAWGFGGGGAGASGATGGGGGYNGGAIGVGGGGFTSGTVISAVDGGAPLYNGGNGLVRIGYA